MKKILGAFRQFFKKKNATLSTKLFVDKPLFNHPFTKPRAARP